jgi:peroxiredoxin Q/BCP
VRGDADKYAAAGVEVFGINGASVQSHRAFRRRHGFTARLLSDRGLLVSTSYDAVVHFGPFRYIDRTVVGIARDGRIAFYQRGFPATDEILAGLSSGDPEPTIR